MGKLEPQKHGGALYRPDKGETPNPKGPPKGILHISTHIQKLLNDPEFAPDTLNGREFKGTPLKAIILTAIQKAKDGDNKWAEWLAKHGYGEKINLEHSGELKTGEYNPQLASEFAEYLKQRTKKDAKE